MTTQALNKVRRPGSFRKQKAGAFEKGESVEFTACAGTKDSRDAHSAFLPALRCFGSDFMGLWRYRASTYDCEWGAVKRRTLTWRLRGDG